MADVSGEAADLVVKEAMEVTEGAIKLAGVGIKNIAAFLIAISNQNNKLLCSRYTCIKKISIH